ncbi:MAG: hypothetical protein PVJ50_06795 [Desulfobacterales bacterium]|jgi:hypothetical protein
MNHNENPVHTKGDKNVFCPYYGNCLDYAVELQWQYWTCLHCQHKQKETFVEDALLLAKDPDPHYSFSPHFYKKATNILL